MNIDVRCVQKPSETEADQPRLKFAKKTADLLNAIGNTADVAGATAWLWASPDNAQVFELQDRISGARIGTVDKFQGQEAPIAIYSMTTSSYTDAPRGMEFLYSLNRLNVATSRAKCICILVASPSVFEAQFRAPRQMQLANAFCRYLELAKAI
jgi:AAA domain